MGFQTTTMVSVTRRGTLQIGGTALVTGLAGCGSVGGRSGATLDVVNVVNEREDPHIVHLLVEHDGEIVYWSSLDLPAATTREGGVIEAEGTVIEDEWPDRPGRIVVHARLDDHSSWNSLALHEKSSGCHMVRAHVERTEQPATDVALLSSGDCRN